MIIKLKKRGSVITTSHSIKDAISSLDDGDHLISIEPREDDRSIRQNRRYWLILTMFARETGNDKDALHADMKKKFLSKKKIMKLGKTRKYAWIIGSTKDLSKKRFVEYTDKVEEFFRDYGFVFPSIDSLEFDSLCNQYL